MSVTSRAVEYALHHPFKLFHSNNISLPLLTWHLILQKISKRYISSSVFNFIAYFNSTPKTFVKGKRCTLMKYVRRNPHLIFHSFQAIFYFWSVLHRYFLLLLQYFFQHSLGPLLPHLAPFKNWFYSRTLLSQQRTMASSVNRMLLCSSLESYHYKILLQYFLGARRRPWCFLQRTMPITLLIGWVCDYSAAPATCSIENMQSQMYITVSTKKHLQGA